ncbi:hypothetical protein ES332_D12G096500v1 [Gossypium tomentosum]|uniref:Uncharacterized protein n=1 Tax=Gossypium tomentosum TaxID=34277 RepID=A0A5D2I779_GOSTO|nr:hypothetical protein ES332_D12G096500v1 [Gossypium tomentosum]
MADGQHRAKEFPIRASKHIQRSELWKGELMRKQSLWPSSEPESDDGKGPSTAGLRVDLGISRHGGAVIGK